MDNSTENSAENDNGGLSISEIGKQIVLLPVRIVRLPFDLLFLTIDYLRLTFWVLRNLPLFFQRLPPRPFSACFDGGILEEAGDQSLWYCPLTAKYGTKSLLKLIFSRFEWYWDEETGRRYLAFVGRRRNAPTTVPRYIFGGLTIVIFWGCVLALVGFVTWERQRISPPTQVAEAPSDSQKVLVDDRDPAQAEQLVQQAVQAQDQGDVQKARSLFRQAIQLDSSNADAFVGMGQTGIALDLLNDAEQSFQQALSLDPDNLDGHLGIAELAHRRGQNKLAIERLENFDTGESVVPEVKILKAKCLFELGDTDGAREAVEEVLTDHPQNLEALEAAALIALRQARLNDAEEHYRAIVDRDSDYVAARVGIGRVLRLKGKIPEAESVLRMTQSEFPGDPRVVSELIDTLVAGGKRQRAFLLCGETVEKYPDLLGLRARLGGLALMLGRDNDAYNAAQDLLALDPGNVAAHSQLAALFLRKDLTTLAVEHAEKAAAQNPNDVNAYRLRITTLMANGDLLQAEERLNRLLQVLPGDLRALMDLSECQQRQGHPEDALQTAQQALEQHPNAAAVHSRIAQILFLLGRRDDAEEHFKKAVALSPDDAKMLNNLAAVINYNDGDPNEALEYAMKAQEIEPMNPQITDTLAWIYMSRGELDKALPLSAVASAVRGDLPNVSYHRGAILAAAGNKDEAVKWLRRALATRSVFEGKEDAQKLLQKLEAEMVSSTP